MTAIIVMIKTASYYLSILTYFLTFPNSFKKSSLSSSQNLRWWQQQQQNKYSFERKRKTRHEWQTEYPFLEAAKIFVEVSDIIPISINSLKL